MNTETTFKIFTILSPFLAATLTFFLGIKGKRKEIDIQKEKELNTITSDLLKVWFTMKQLHELNTIPSIKSYKGIFPIELLPKLLFKSNVINTSCFEELHKSIDELKKYEPVLYFRLITLSQSLDSLYSKYILPISNNIEYEGVLEVLQVLSKDSVEIIETVEGALDEISSSINKKENKKIIDFFESDTSIDFDEFINSYNQFLFDVISATVSGSEEMTLEEFVQLGEEDQELKNILKETLLKTINEDFNYDKLFKEENEKHIDIQQTI